MRSEQQWEMDATKRYLTDPAFYARIQKAYSLTMATAARAGVPAQELAALEAGIVLAATYGAMAMEADLGEIFGPGVMIDFGLAGSEVQMMKTAQRMGLQVIKSEEA